MESERDRVAQILRAALDAALLERDSASEAFDLILREIPSGLPHPDGVQRIKNASSAVSAARYKMIEAATRLREFENRGIIPEDLKKPNTPPPGFRPAHSRQRWALGRWRPVLA
jgi:hypothetical protein